MISNPCFCNFSMTFLDILPLPESWLSCHFSRSPTIAYRHEYTLIYYCLDHFWPSIVLNNKVLKNLGKFYFVVCFPPSFNLSFFSFLFTFFLFFFQDGGALPGVWRLLGMVKNKTRAQSLATSLRVSLGGRGNDQIKQSLWFCKGSFPRDKILNMNHLQLGLFQLLPLLKKKKTILNTFISDLSYGTKIWKLSFKWHGNQRHLVNMAKNLKECTSISFLPSSWAFKLLSTSFRT